MPVDVGGLREFGQHRLGHIRGQEVVQVNVGERVALGVPFRVIHCQLKVLGIVKHKTIAQIHGGHVHALLRKGRVNPTNPTMLGCKT